MCKHPWLWSLVLCVPPTIGPFRPYLLHISVCLSCQSFSSTSSPQSCVSSLAAPWPLAGFCALYLCSLRRSHCGFVCVDVLGPLVILFHFPSQCSNPYSPPVPTRTMESTRKHCKIILTSLDNNVSIPSRLFQKKKKKRGKKILCAFLCSFSSGKLSSWRFERQALSGNLSWSRKTVLWLGEQGGGSSSESVSRLLGCLSLKGKVRWLRPSELGSVACHIASKAHPLHRTYQFISCIRKVPVLGEYSKTEKHFATFEKWFHVLSSAND